MENDWKRKGREREREREERRKRRTKKDGDKEKKVNGEESERGGKMEDRHRIK